MGYPRLDETLLCQDDERVCWTVNSRGNQPVYGSARQEVSDLTVSLTELRQLREARNRLLFLKESFPEFLDRLILEIRAKEPTAERLQSQDFYDWMCRTLLGIQPLRKRATVPRRLGPSVWKDARCPDCGRLLLENLTLPLGVPALGSRLFCLWCMHKAKKARA